jgi:amino acid adenylation domain-containing protein
MDELDKRTAALSPAKRALLAQRLKEKKANVEHKGIGRLIRHGPTPLSFNQERLWFLNQLEPDTAAFNLPNWLRIEGGLDLSVLRRCVNEILRRHEVLRTRFEAVDGRPVQILEPFTPLEIPLVDLSSLPAQQRETDALRLCMDEARRPFDLARESMLRAKLFRLEKAEHIFFFNRHHIASDGWSRGVFMRELETLYQAFKKGQPSPLVELPFQYADFAVWQRESLQGDGLEKQIGYWRKQLEGSPAWLELPTDRRRPATPNYSGGLVSDELPESLALALEELSRHEGVTLFMTLLAAFQTLLHRYTRSDDVPVGSVVAGRNRVELEGLIGFFANTLVFRGDLSGDPSFRALLKRTRTACMGAYAHPDMPFEGLVKELRPERDLSHSPFFQVMFVLQDAPAPAMEIPGLRVTPPNSIETGASEFELTLSVTEREKSLSASIEYRKDLFDAETVRRLLKHYQNLLEAVTANPEARISTLPLLSSTERLELLVEQNQRNYSSDLCIHELFAEQAHKAPDNVAVVFERQKLTYRELDRRSEQLARHLRGLGVGPDVLVGLCVERSLEMVVGMLGVLKAGGAYVPLDPAYPRERIAFMLDDTQAPLVLTQRSLLGSIPIESARALCLDEFDWSANRENNPSNKAGPGNLAYVIYTSGSTGRPKGVMIEHRALVSYASVAADYYAIVPGDHVLQFASMNFDASLEEICCTLTRGATLFLRTEQMLGSIQSFTAQCRKWKLSVLSLPTAFWHELVNRIGEKNVELPESLRLVVIGGERALPERVAKWNARYPSIRLVNSYGPTEATVVATVWDLPRRSNTPSPEEVPIGKPFLHTEALVLDQNLQLVPMGVIGELHLGGASLARGYLNQPELTRSKFIIHPFRPGERLYKTGDLVRYLADGNLVFQGRVDEQVKIRGFRVELGEIEALLRQHPCVQDTVVVAREDSGQKTLVAYIVPKQQLEPTAVEFRGFLKARLPGYMVPAAFVTIGNLPLTPNGKVDRRALPEPNAQGQSDEFIAPTDELETELVRIWESALGRHPISIRDNFFDLGGHSLLAVSVFSDIETKLGKNLPLATLYQAPTIEQLAKALRDRGWSPPWSPLVAIKSEGTNPPLFCVHGINGGVLYYRSLGAYLEPQQPFYGLQSPGLDGSPVTTTTIEAFAELYINAIRTVQPKGPYLLSGYSSGGIIAFEMAQQLRANGDEVALLALFDTSHPRVRGRRYTLGERFAMRRREISNLPPQDAFRYLFRRFCGMAKARTAKYRGELQKLSYKSERSRGSAISYRYRHLHVQEIHSKALERYEPAPYFGRLTLFRAENMDTGYEYEERLGWNGSAAGGLEIVKFPGSHGGLFHGTSVRNVAAELSHRIRDALG